VLAAIAGFLLATIGARVIQRFDRRIDVLGTIERDLATRVLGDVPRSRRLRWRPGKQDSEVLGEAEREAFRLLRTNLTYLSLDDDLNSILVTSASPGEGKTTVAIHLAEAFAESGSRTLLMEADLRRPTIAARMKLGATPGLTRVLVGEVPLERAVARVPMNVPVNGGAGLPFTVTESVMLEVLAAGGVPPNPLDVLESRRFEDLFARVRESYDVVVVDAPPVLGLSDVTPLSKRVSGTLIVARSGVVTSTAMRALERQLSLIGARVLGLVVNDSPAAVSEAYYSAASLTTDK
jgi:capsular exopolysaccharide synthesis family protein